MLIHEEVRKMNDLVTEGIENKLNKIHTAKKAVIESDLKEKIRLYREEAEERIRQIEEEVEREKKDFADYKALLHEVRNKAGGFRYRKKIKQLRKFTDELLTKASELNQKVNMLHQRDSDKEIFLKEEKRNFS